MMNLDCKRIAKDPLMKGNGKDCFLVELKGFEKQNSQKIESESQADKHEYVLIYPQGSGRPSGKRVPLTQKTSQRDYGMPDNMMKGPAEQDLYMQGKIVWLLYECFVALLLISQNLFEKIVTSWFVSL